GAGARVLHRPGTGRFDRSGRHRLLPSDFGPPGAARRRCPGPSSTTRVRRSNMLTGSDRTMKRSAVVEAPTDALREAGLRATRQRLTVLEALRARQDIVTAQDLHAELRAAGEPVGLTTVYRTLAALAQA